MPPENLEENIVKFALLIIAYLKNPELFRRNQNDLSAMLSLVKIAYPEIVEIKDVIDTDKDYLFPWRAFSDESTIHRVATAWLDNVCGIAAISLIHFGSRGETEQQKNTIQILQRQIPSVSAVAV